MGTRSRSMARVAMNPPESPERPETPPASGKGVLACVGTSPGPAAQVLRKASRLAALLNVDWVALHVETPAGRGVGQAGHQDLQQNFRLADELGAECVTVSGPDVVSTVLEYARSRNVSTLVVGHSEPGSDALPSDSTVLPRLLESADGFDIYSVQCEQTGAEEPSPAKGKRIRRRDWLATGGVLVAATMVSWVFDVSGFSEANLVMVYLLGVVFVATRFGIAPALASSFVSVLLFDVFFTVPHFAINVHDSQYLITFVVMAVIGILISTLTNQVRRQVEVSRRNETRNKALYHLARQLTGVSGRDNLIAVAEQTVSQTLGGRIAILLPNSRGEITEESQAVDRPLPLKESDILLARRAFSRSRQRAPETGLLVFSDTVYCSLSTPNGRVGMLAIRHPDPDSVFMPEGRRLLETHCAQIALALERDRLTDESQQARLEVEAEKLRSTLLSSISHDLRTPLAAIAGASSSLAKSYEMLSPETRADLLETIDDEAQQLHRLVENVLHMTRLTSGAVRVERDWHPVEDVIGSALNRIDRQLGGREVITRVPGDLPLGNFDAVLIEQVLVNLLDNALKYSPQGTPIEIQAFSQHGEIIIEVADRGPGIAAQETQLIFQEFHRNQDVARGKRGTGLGLSICRAIVEAHSGSVMAENRPEGGSLFRFRLPTEGIPPSMPDEAVPSDLYADDQANYRHH